MAFVPSAGQEIDLLISPRRTLAENFEGVLRDTAPHDRARLLEAVYRQLSEQSGVYFRAAQGRPESDVTHFTQWFTDTLFTYGLVDEACALMSLDPKYQAQVHVVRNVSACLDRLDAGWREYAFVHRHGDGARIDVGGFQSNPFSASILQAGGDIKWGTYELYPKFDGKSLDQMRLHVEPILTHLSLDVALEVAGAARSRDLGRYVAAVTAAKTQPTARRQGYLLPERAGT